jgi:vancomycin resistance protein YoaR
VYKPAKSGKSKIQFKASMQPGNLKVMLLGAGGVLFVGFIILLIFALNTRPAFVEVPKDYVFKDNIYIGGVDIGGMDKAKAEKALKAKETELLNKIKIVIDVSGKEITYKAADLGIGTNREDAMAEALLYARMGGAYKDEKEMMEEKGEGVNFKLKPQLDSVKAKKKLTADTEKLNVKPVDAKVIFDASNLANPIKFEKEKSGAEVDIAGLLTKITQAVDTQKFTKITAPIKEAKPKYTLNQIQSKTKQIGHFESSFGGTGLHGKNRVFNIVKMAQVINGQIIDPGQVWSMNTTAGPRTEPEWKAAPGIENGVYTDQAGGGVCQVSSTLYNAALQAELEIVERKPHSWPSTYIKPGLDATISTGGPDLKIRNNSTMPVYIVANADKDKMTCTVDIYGEPLKHGYKVNMVSKVVSTVLPPKPEVKEMETDQNGEPLEPGKSIKVRDAKSEVHVKIYKQYVDANNKVVRVLYIGESVYAAKAIIYYQNNKTPETDTKKQS